MFVDLTSLMTERFSLASREGKMLHPSVIRVVFVCLFVFLFLFLLCVCFN